MKTAEKRGPIRRLQVWAYGHGMDRALVYEGIGRGTAARIAADLVAYRVATSTEVEADHRFYGSVGDAGKVLLDALAARKARR